MPPLARIGTFVLDLPRRVSVTIDWVGTVAVAFGRVSVRKARLEHRALWIQLQLAGVHALWTVIIGSVACFKGLHAGRSSETVVDSIVLVIAAAAVFAAMFYMVKI